MSKMSELSQVLDEMISCGEGMIKAANAIKDIFSRPCGRLRRGYFSPRHALK